MCLHEGASLDGCAEEGRALRCPWHGRRIAPQIGLVPIGRNPESGLWEFADVGSFISAHTGNRPYGAAFFREPPYGDEQLRSLAARIAATIGSASSPM